MSKTIETDRLGFNVKVVNAPTTIDEAVAAFGGEQQLIDAATDNIINHKMGGDIRGTICEALAKHLGITRETKKVSAPTKADPAREINVNTESDAEFVKKALATAGVTAAEVAADVIPAEGFPFDAISEPRTGATRGPGKAMLALAEKLIAAGAAVYDKSIGMLEAANPTATPVVRDATTNVPTAESLAALIKANQQRVEQESLAALGVV